MSAREKVLYVVIAAFAISVAVAQTPAVAFASLAGLALFLGLQLRELHRPRPQSWVSRPELLIARLEKSPDRPLEELIGQHVIDRTEEVVAIWPTGSAIVKGDPKLTIADVRHLRRWN